MGVYTTTKDMTWDLIAKETLGDEFRLDELMSTQVAKDFSSPIYSFVVAEGTTIDVPQTKQERNEFKAPWED